MMKATILFVLGALVVGGAGCSTTTEQGVTVQRPWYSDAQSISYPDEPLS